VQQVQGQGDPIVATPRVRFTQGGRVTETLSVDYATVFHQAVANERAKVLRDLRKIVERLEVTQPDVVKYRTNDLPASRIKAEVLSALSKLENEVS